MSASKPVGFRLDESCHARLTEAARKQGTSPGDLARSLVTAALDGDGGTEILSELAALRTDVEGLRRDVRAMRPGNGHAEPPPVFESLLAEVTALGQSFAVFGKSTLPKLTKELTALRREIEEMRQDHRLATLVLLKASRMASLGREEDLKRWEAECRAWIVENLES